MKKYALVRRQLMAIERAAWGNPRMRRILKSAPLVVLFLLLNTRSAHAACSFNPTPDPTADGASDSLRAAIEAANASGQDCLIQLQAGTYTLTIKNTNGQENNAAEGDLDITDSGHTVTIQGHGARVSIINGGGVNGIDDRVFQVLDSANAVFKRLTIEGGVANDDGATGAPPGTTESEGGGLLVQNGGHVTLSHVWVEGNQAVGGAGKTPTIYPTGTQVGQAAAGGGLFLSAGTVDLKDSKTVGNAAIGGQGAPSKRYFGSGGAGTGGAGAGGGLYVLSGTARLFGSMVSDDHVAGGAGARGSCIYSSPNAGSTFCVHGGNGGSGQGAGLFVGAGTLRIAQTTISRNQAIGGSGFTGTLIGSGTGNGGSAHGAGIFVTSASISIVNSTVFANIAKGGPANPAPSRSGGSGNGGDGAGGGLYLSGGSVSLTGDTVASNHTLFGYHSTVSSGGGVANVGAGLSIDTTLIGKNTQDSRHASNGNDVFGPLISSHSLIANTAGATITNHGGNIFDQDPLLDPDGLRSNGGSTETVALELGSPAIAKGDNAVCAAPAPRGLTGVDQRGYDRFPNGRKLCDIGAFEFYNLLVHPKFEGFAPQTVGQHSQPRNLFITNNQTTRVALRTTIGGNDRADFVENDNCGATLAANASCTIAITFKPAASGNRRAVLSVSDSPDRTSPYTVKLTGEGK